MPKKIETEVTREQLLEHVEAVEHTLYQLRLFTDGMKGKKIESLVLTGWAQFERNVSQLAKFEDTVKAAYDANGKPVVTNGPPPQEAEAG